MRDANVNINLSYLEVNSGGNPVFIKDIIKAYLKTEVGLIHLLQKKITLSDDEGVKFYSHKLKTSFATVGAEQAVNFVDELENININKIDNDSKQKLIHELDAMRYSINKSLLEVLSDLN